MGGLLVSVDTPHDPHYPMACAAQGTADMESQIRINDVAIWFKHLPSRSVADRLSRLPAEGETTVEIDGVTGRWRRMKLGVDGRLPDAIIPVGPMKTVWSEWYRTRRGETVTLRVVDSADDWLAATAPLFSEWNSPEDDEAFRDL